MLHLRLLVLLLASPAHASECDVEHLDQGIERVRSAFVHGRDDALATAWAGVVADLACAETPLPLPTQARLHAARALVALRSDDPDRVVAALRAAREQGAPDQLAAWLPPAPSVGFAWALSACATDTESPSSSRSAEAPGPAAQVVLDGAVRQSSLIAASGRVHPVGPIPPGRYTLRARLPSRPVDATVELGTLRPGQVVVVRCRDDFGMCARFDP